MRAEKQEHFLHQYLDQTADLEFSLLFEEYRRISTSAKDRRQAKEKEMFDSDFETLRRCAARSDSRLRIRRVRDLCRVVQNAEDAYLAADQLGLPEPPSRSVTFSYSTATMENLNCHSLRASIQPLAIRQQADRCISHDVEGVLKSADRFKPHSAEQGARRSADSVLASRAFYLGDRRAAHSLRRLAFRDHRGCIPNETRIPMTSRRD